MFSDKKKKQILIEMDRLGIIEADLHEKFILASGRGGQKVQKTHSCVQLKHIPSGIQVSCQKSRSREDNRLFARRLLCEKFVETFEPEKSKKLQANQKRKKQKLKQDKRSREKHTKQEEVEDLPEEVLFVCRQKGTEKPFSGKYVDHFEEGSYHCIICKQPLFSSEDKYKTECGWPSFTKPIEENALAYAHDTSHKMHRIEVKCSQCDAHLGHVFDDGPAPRFKRYCINSIALSFEAISQEN